MIMKDIFCICMVSNPIFIIKVNQTLNETLL